MIPDRIIQTAVSLISGAGKRPPMEKDLASLAAMFQQHPKDAALLVTVLARMASADLNALARLAVWEHALDEGAKTEAAKAAHAAFAAGRNTPEIEDGERLYQRVRKREQRARKRDLASAA